MPCEFESKYLKSAFASQQTFCNVSHSNNSINDLNKLNDFAADYLGVLVDGEEVVFEVNSKSRKAKTKEILKISDLEEEKRNAYLLDTFNVLFNGYERINEDFENTNEKKKLFEEIENPLVLILANMETAGIKVDINVLKRYSDMINEKLKDVTEKIYGYAGCSFNISSPKQLSEILFEKLNISSKKKTKTGMSTSAETLEKLIEEHPIIIEVLEY